MHPTSAEHSVLAVQPGGVHSGDEKLAAIGVRACATAAASLDTAAKLWPSEMLSLSHHHDACNPHGARQMAASSKALLSLQLWELWNAMVSKEVLPTRTSRICLKPCVEPPLVTAMHRRPPALAMLSRPLPLCLILKFSSCRNGQRAVR